MVTSMLCVVVIKIHVRDSWVYSQSSDFINLNRIYKWNISISPLWVLNVLQIVYGKHLAYIVNTPKMLNIIFKELREISGTLKS